MRRGRAQAQGSAVTKERRHLPVVHPDERYQENYALRTRVADEARAELAAAIAACGPGAVGYCRWTLHDKLGIEPPRYFYGCRRPEHVGWQPRPPDSDERVTAEGVTFVTESGIRYPCSPLTIGGVTHYPYRWSLSFQAITAYNPQTPDQMKAAAERRRAAAIAKRAAERAAERAARAADPQIALPGFDTSDQEDP